MEKEYLTTSELLAYLKQHPDCETKCRLLLGHGLGSTHYLYWDSNQLCFMHTRDWQFSPLTENEVTEWYDNCKWRIEQ